MKTTKIKRYRLGVSRTFPKTHPRCGEHTNFETNILMMLQGFNRIEYTKIHTIRSNYELWEKRMKEVQEGKAVIELFYWEGKPRRSKQIVFATLDKDSGCGVQELKEPANFVCATIDGKINHWGVIAKNDGLTFDDFCEWFKGYDLLKPMAIVHFTSFRY